ncbi:lipoprotein insertase outer membrane protein LolB [Methylibium sp.]|uniref:lipoprotein insertase outer membrane protein LolB n=1 Tax=Methylibium sp. TaxID=2067992 RepID=UPI003D0ADC86
MRRRALVAACAGGAWLAGCASVAPPVGGERLAGRLSVSVEGDAARAFHAGFELEGSAQSGGLSLTTPLGTQVARADWSPQQVRLRSGDGDRVYPDLESMAADALGERVPLAALFDWLRGRPWPGAASAGRPQGFVQLGWVVDVSRRSEGWVEARRIDAPVVTVRAKLDTP